MPETLCPNCGHSPIPYGAETCPKCHEPFDFLQMYKRGQRLRVDKQRDHDDGESTVFGGNLTGEVSAHPGPIAAVFFVGALAWFLRVGGVLGSLGLITGGLLGYGLMRTSARRLAQRVAGPRSLQKMQRLFDRGGAWAIILTRGLSHSILEAMVFLAGLAGMPMAKVTAALTIGSVPTAFAFAAIGAGWADQPMLALVVSSVLPILVLPIALYLLRRRAQ